MQSPEATKPKLHAGYMEVAIAQLLGYRRNVIVPNVSWGLGLNHECDMLVLSPGKKLTEIEIKVTFSDFKRDFDKRHGHTSKYISRLVYALPSELIDRAMPMIPRECGVISVEHYGHSFAPFRAQWVRQARHSKLLQPVPDSVINKLYELGCMRIWDLKLAYYNAKSKK